jgi:hypothetical protein
MRNLPARALTRALHGRMFRRAISMAMINSTTGVTMNDMNGTMQLIDLGDAGVETRQGSPTPPVYVDAIYGHGSKPTLED